jgi:hypothetical protein
VVEELDYMLKSTPPLISFSSNPMWAWEFGNCAKELGRTALARIIKGGPVPSHKIDNVMALLDALYCFDMSEGKIDN